MAKFVSNSRTRVYFCTTSEETRAHPSPCLQALMRPSDPTVEDGRILRSSSADGGVTWTPVEATRLKTPNSGFDAAKLSDGRVVLAHNFKSLGTLRWVPSDVLYPAP